MQGSLHYTKGTMSPRKGLQCEKINQGVFLEGSVSKVPGDEEKY